MSKKYLSTIAIVSAFILTASAVHAYPQNTLFGTGYGFAGYNNFSNGASEASAIRKPAKQFIETKETTETTETAGEAKNYSEKPISNLSSRDHDEAPNAGYKTTYTYIEKDMSDYNPYTGADAGVNDTKSIYTDDLGRLHFFGKGSRFRTNK